MKIELINTGTELLLGNTLNTHLGWIARQLFPHGLRIARQTTVPDGKEIRQALLESSARGARVVLVTGGLGPTSDDITRELVAELLGLPLCQSGEVMEAIRARCALRGIPVRENMLRQTMVPESATVLPNRHGTAPGLYLQPSENVALPFPHLFLLPGPPRELYPMFLDSVLPLLLPLRGADSAAGEMRVYRVVGMGESAVEEQIGADISRAGELEVGYCARPNEVDFRLIGPPRALEAWHERILAVLGDNLVCVGEETLEAVVVARLAALGFTVATAESCTGGMLANRITNVPGASACFLSGFVSYSNESKARLLEVNAALIEQHGAVSEPVAAAMAQGALARTGADWAAATTGIAGPGGGTPEKPVGTVFIAVAARAGSNHVEKFCFPSDRESFKQIATQAALDLLRRQLVAACPSTR